MDLSRPHIRAAVVRLIIPEMESWFLTDFDPGKCQLGRRAQRYLSRSRSRPASPV